MRATAELLTGYQDAVHEATVDYVSTLADEDYRPRRRRAVGPAGDAGRPAGERARRHPGARRPGVVRPRPHRAAGLSPADARARRSRCSIRSASDGETTSHTQSQCRATSAPTGGTSMRALPSTDQRTVSVTASPSRQSRAVPGQRPGDDRDLLAVDADDLTHPDPAAVQDVHRRAGCAARAAAARPTGTPRRPGSCGAAVARSPPHARCRRPGRRSAPRAGRPDRPASTSSSRSLPTQ